MENENNECCIKQRTRAHSDSPARAWLARIRMAKTETDLNATHFMWVFVCLRFWLLSSVFFSNLAANGDVRLLNTRQPQAK